MGARGQGSGKQREAAEGPLETDLPWEAVGLSRPERVIAFLEWLPITKGKLEGRKMKLLPCQLQFIHEVYGKIADDGKRLVKIAIQSEPKGNGKTGMTAGLCLCHLLGPECEPRGEVYSAAIDRDQAGIMFEEMHAIILAVPNFAAVTNVTSFTKRIQVVTGDGAGSKYEALSSDARGAQGRAPSLWVYDELAQAKDRRLLDNLMQGMSKRDEALGIILSTQAPDDTHPLSELIDDGLAGNDPRMYVQLMAAPEDAPLEEATYKACNPAWGAFLDIADFMSQAAMMKRIPSHEPAFRNLRLNQRIHATADDRMLTPALWKQAGAVARLITPGMRCFGGLDLSKKNDLTALVLVFPGENQSYTVKPFFWTPLGVLEDRKPSEEALFRLWIKQGHIEGIKGKVIRLHQVVAKMIELSKIYDIVKVAYDPWRIEELKIEFNDAGVKTDEWLVPWAQSFKEMSPAIDKVQELALAGQLFQPNNPVLTSCVSNATIVRDTAGNMKIDKSKTPGGAIRIDGAVAMAMGIGLATINVDAAPKHQLIFV